MDDLGDDQIELKVYGLEHVNGREVPATVFASKLTALVRALHLADEIAHGRSIHVYTIARLHTSEPTAILRERSAPKLVALAAQSAIPLLERGVASIEASAKGDDRFARFAASVAKLTRGADRQFGYGTVRSRSNVFRIDGTLYERAQRAGRLKAGVPDGGWYQGAVAGSFDGKLDYVDVRGDLPQIKLTLSAGGAQIDCVCRKEDIEALGQELDHRVRVHGRAIYDGRSGLPRRVDVSSIEPISAPGDFSRWQGSFRPFKVVQWDEVAS